MAPQVAVLMYFAPPATLVAIGTTMEPEAIQKMEPWKLVRLFLFWPFHLMMAFSIIAEYGSSAAYNTEAVCNEWMDSHFGKDGVLRAIAEVIL